VTPPTEEPLEVAERSAHGAWLVLGATFLMSTALGVFLFAQYSATLSYVKSTLEEPTTAFPWDSSAFEPEECIDYAMGWAADCDGIKSMCDMYVDQVMNRCLLSTDRAEYCEALGDRGMTTEFGAQECFARGTQRNVDAEACSLAYRHIDSFCSAQREGSGAGEGDGA
jgi:hypothetical protein